MSQTELHPGVEGPPRPSWKPRSAVEIRMGRNADGQRIGKLVWEAGYKMEGVDWSDIEPYWLVAANNGELIGCLEVCPGKPIGRLELLGIDNALSHRLKAETAKALVLRGMAILRAGGSQFSSCLVPDEYKGYLKIIKRRGGVVTGKGNMIEKRLV